MSGHGANLIFFNGRPEHLLTPIPLRLITSHFYLTPHPHPPPPSAWAFISVSPFNMLIEIKLAKIFHTFEKNILLLLAYLCQDQTSFSTYKTIYFVLTRLLFMLILLVSMSLIFENSNVSSANILHIYFKPSGKSFI